MFRLCAVLLACCQTAWAQAPLASTPGGQPGAAFPLSGLLPKLETQAAAFLKEHAEFDGRGVTVAVLDSGVDPGAPGLQWTSDGRPKIVDLIDGTGSGDVQMSAPRAAENGHLTGLTGRRLKLDPSWNSRDQMFRVGVKSGFSFFPSALIGPLKQARRQRSAQRQLQIEQQFEQRLQQAAVRDDPSLRREIGSRRQALATAWKRYRDPGPVYDCVTFHDGSAWRAVVDTDADGDLTDELLMSSFRRQQQYATFPAPADLNFGVNIYDDGRTLSIVTDSGAHGTHVAGIIGGYHPQAPERNGVAPGVQIVSVKIGDPRLGGMESGLALLRAARAVLRHKCDLVNMSFGEPTGTPNRGMLIREFSRLVDENGVLFVASAGNGGPALSTVGAPGGTSSAIIGVGAYVSPLMMTAEYALPQTERELAYTWTSRGPTADGDLGVDIMAPGGAFSSVPAWTRTGSRRMNGTSMAAPNACGCLALLISAARSASLPCPPYAVRRAVQNTARFVETADVFSQGPGLIQVQRAFAYLKTYANRLEQRIAFDVQVQDSPTRRGVFLRQQHASRQKSRWTIRVKPKWPQHVTTADRQRLQLYLNLESNQPWIRCGQHLALTAAGQSFQVEIDPTQLPHGVHLGSICGRVAGDAAQSVLFKVPITVLRLQSTPDGRASEELTMRTGDLQRRFFQVPEAATLAVLKLSTDSQAPRRRFVVHAVPHTSGDAFRDRRFRNYVTLKAGRPVTRSFPVVAGETLELCLGQYWSSPGAGSVKYELSFRGLAQRQPLVLAGDAVAVPVELRAVFGTESLQFRSSLTHCRTLLPVHSVRRDRLQTARDRAEDRPTLSRLTLSYALLLDTDQNLSLSFPPAQALLYESQWGGCVCHVYDAHRRRVLSDDVFPGTHSLKAGRYTVELELVANNEADFKIAEQTALVVERKLSRPLSLSVHANRFDALAATRPLSQATLERGQHARYYLARPPLSALAAFQPGAILVGTLAFGESAGVAVARSLPVACVVPAPPTQNSPQQTTTRESSDRALRRLHLDRLKTEPVVVETEAYERTFQAFIKQYPKDVDAHVARVTWLDDIRYRKQRLPLVVAAVDESLELIDTEQLARELGLRKPEAPARRDLLADLLYRKGRALGYMELPDVVKQFPIPDAAAHQRAFEHTFSELQRWVDTRHSKYALLHVRRDRRRGHLGAAMELLHRLQDKNPDNYWYYKKLRDLYGELKWEHLQADAAAWMVIRFPDRLQ